MQEKEQALAVKVKSREELKALVDQIPEGTMLSLDLEVIETHEQDHGRTE